MATLDFTFEHGDLVSLENVTGASTNGVLQTLDRQVSRWLVSRPQAEPAAHRPDQTAKSGSRPIYSLLDDRTLHATSGLPTVSVQDVTSSCAQNTVSVQSVTTPDYAEFVLQLLDKNSALSSIMILVAYIMIFRAL